jgi:hypothetical protein
MLPLPLKHSAGELHIPWEGVGPFGRGASQRHVAWLAAIGNHQRERHLQDDVTNIAHTVCNEPTQAISDALLDASPSAVGEQPGDESRRRCVGGCRARGGGCQDEEAQQHIYICKGDTPNS